MRRTLVWLACLFATSAATAAPCPATEQDAAAFVAALQIDEAAAEGGGRFTTYRPGDTEVLGVRPFYIQLQGVPALRSISRLRFDYEGEAATTRAAFQAAFRGASCGTSGTCEWSDPDADDGHLNAVRTQDLYGGRIALLCDYR